MSLSKLPPKRPSGAGISLFLLEKIIRSYPHPFA
jgi:hypothetical protein